MNLMDLLGDDGTALAEAGEQARRKPDEVRAVSDVVLRPPVSPPSIRDFSAFEEHCRNGLKALGRDLSPEWYETPVFYFANPGSVVGTDEVVRRPGNSVRLDFELEIGAVIGRPGSDLDPTTAEQHIAGYLIYNDWSARDLQGQEMELVPIGPAKGKDFANGLGPVLVTPDEIADRRSGAAYDLAMTATVNGHSYSTGNWADIYWSFGEMLAYASRGANLRTGEVIGSGTCGSGCILELSATHGSEAYPWLEPGDEVVLEVEHMGTLCNTIAEGVPVAPLRVR
jgi:2-keto-4-pentenoate hydratase/2-oxohepta-3-ene-1,7-dioic acid hydratase in catechol pathway